MYVFTGEAQPGCDNWSYEHGEESEEVHLRAIRSIRSLIATDRSAALLYMYRLGSENELGMTVRRVFEDVFEVFVVVARVDRCELKIKM